MPDIAEGRLAGGRVAGVSSGSGYRLDREGVHFARGVLGDLASTNFTTGADGTGWRFRADGSAELDAAAIRGTLSAEHIDADVRNWELITDARDLAPISVTVPNLTSYHSLYFVVTVRGVGTLASVDWWTHATIAVSDIPSSGDRGTLGLWTGWYMILNRSGNTVSGTRWVPVRNGGEAMYLEEVWGLRNPS